MYTYMHTNFTPNMNKVTQEKYHSHYNIASYYEPWNVYTFTVSVYVPYLMWHIESTAVENIKTIALCYRMKQDDFSWKDACVMTITVSETCCIINMLFYDPHIQTMKMCYPQMHRMSRDSFCLMNDLKCCSDWSTHCYCNRWDVRVSKLYDRNCCFAVMLNKATFVQKKVWSHFQWGSCTRN